MADTQSQNPRRADLTWEDLREACEACDACEVSDARGASVRSGKAISRAAERIAAASDRAEVLEAILGMPHPAFLEAAKARFDEGMFKELRDGSKISELRLERLNTAEIHEALRLLASEIRHSWHQVQILIGLCDQLEEYRRFPALAKSFKVTKADVVSHLDATIKPWETNCPEFVAWCAKVFQDLIDESQSSRQVAVLSASMFPDARMYCALLLAGADMSETAIRSMPYSDTPWTEDFHRMASSGHGVLKLRGALGDLNIADLFGSDEAPILARLAPVLIAGPALSQSA